MKGESKNRENWQVGKITELIKDADGLYRISKVKIGDTEYTNEPEANDTQGTSKQQLPHHYLSLINELSNSVFRDR